MITRTFYFIQVTQLWILALLGTSLASVATREPKQIPLNEAPYQVSITVNNAHVCSGVVLSKKYVLTAATCVVPFKKNTEILLPMHLMDNHKSVQITRVTPHTDFEPEKSKIAYNLAVVQTMTESSHLRYSTLHLPNHLTRFHDRVNIEYIGFSKNGLKGQLRRIPLKHLSTTDCHKLVNENYDHVICAETVSNDLHDTDIGGPMMAGSDIIGVKIKAIDATLNGKKTHVYVGTNIQPTVIQKFVESYRS